MKLFLASFLLVTTFTSADQFSDYWYGGKAEVAVYDLQQSRYGEVRDGTSTLIFVTEPFSKRKHVKLDAPDSAGTDRANVLKLNKTKKYNTGVYPYSVMTSSFADVNTADVFKVSTSVQEWCGHVYMQANQKKNGDYKYAGFSYFETEGDQEEVLSKTLLEEAIFLQVRLNKLEVGEGMQVTPSQEVSRMLHFPYSPNDSKIELKEGKVDNIVTVSYSNPLDLKLEVVYGKEFPYVIKGWKEQYTKRGQTHTTTATLKSVQQLPYWGMNATKYEKVRKEIGLE